MVLWRISNHLDLTGLGGERGDARWHTRKPARRIIYLAEHPALALIETLVNLKVKSRFRPEVYQLLCVNSGQDLAAKRVTEEALPEDWRDNLEVTREIGNAWLDSNESPLLAVPSAPSPESANYLLNPNHPAASQVEIVWSRLFRYDERFFRVSE